MSLYTVSVGELVEHRGHKMEDVAEPHTQHTTARFVYGVKYIARHEKELQILDVALPGCRVLGRKFFELQYLNPYLE